MLTLLGYGGLAILVAVALFLAASYLLPAGEQIAPPVRDEPLWDLPAGRTLTPDDVAAVRLPVALRGYRFAETDSLLDRLGDELRARDEELARLRRHVPPHLDESGERWEPVDDGDPRADGESVDDADPQAEGESVDAPDESPDDAREQTHEP